MKREFSPECFNCEQRPRCELLAMAASKKEKMLKRAGFTVVEGAVSCAGPETRDVRSASSTIKYCGKRIVMPLLGTDGEAYWAKKLLEIRDEVKGEFTDLYRRSMQPGDPELTTAELPSE